MEIFMDGDRMFVNGVEYVPASKEENPTLNEHERKEVQEVADKLAGAFDWASTREGFQYWDDIYTRLQDLANGGAL